MPPDAVRDRIDRTGKSGYRPATDTRSCRLQSRPKPDLIRASIFRKRRQAAGSGPAMTLRESGRQQTRS